MASRIELSATATKRFSKMGTVETKRIMTFLDTRIASLEDPRQTGKALQGSKLGNLWRYRVGEYRIVCELQDQKLLVLVVEIGHRREVYR